MNKAVVYSAHGTGVNMVFTEGTDGVTRIAAPVSKTGEMTSLVVFRDDNTRTVFYNCQFELTYGAE